jgi:hypothetical protein
MGEETELSKSFREAVARWLRTLGLDVVVVTTWDEYLDRYNTGCDTTWTARASPSVTSTTGCSVIS